MIKPPVLALVFAILFLAYARSPKKLQEVDNKDLAVEAMVQFGTHQFNNMSKEIFKYVPKEVMTATKVGTNVPSYFIDVVLAKTKCLKSARWNELCIPEPNAYLKKVKFTVTTNNRENEEVRKFAFETRN
uniref:Cystatin domain-containing protein n=1 Tax=Panagrellus redivivus TaxID=6233 RepID=A0A7E4UN78_PANRE